MTPELLTGDEAQQITEPFHDYWVKAHLRAWDFWQELIADKPHLAKPLGSSQRFDFLHQHVEENLRTELEGRALFPKSDFFSQLIDNKVLLLFKHLNYEFRPERSGSEQQDNLARQVYVPRLAEQLELDTVAPTCATVGFTLTAGEDAISQVVVVCHVPSYLWHFPIYDSEAGSGTSGIGSASPFPSMPPVAPRIASKRRQDGIESERGK